MNDKCKRVLAAIIDLYIICFLSTSLVGVSTLGKFNITPFSITIYLISSVLFLLVKDFVFKNASIGKRICKLKIVKNDGTKLLMTDIIKRNMTILSFLPVEVFLLIVQNKRLGDLWAKTSIVYQVCIK